MLCTVYTLYHCGRFSGYIISRFIEYFYAEAIASRDFAVCRIRFSQYITLIFRARLFLFPALYFMCQNQGILLTGFIFASVIVLCSRGFGENFPSRCRVYIRPIGFGFTKERHLESWQVNRRHLHILLRPTEEAIRRLGV